MEFKVKKFQENLIKLMSIHNISGHELHRNTGIPTSTIQRLCTEKRPNPTISTLKPIADFFSISLNQLIGDTPLPNEYTIGISFQKHETWKNILIITWEEALNWLSGNINITNKPVVSTDIDVGKNVFALEIPNNDWVGFRKGSILIVDPDVAPMDRGFVISTKKGLDSTTMKKYLIYDGEVYLEPLNKIFKTVDLSNDFIILGTVIQLKLDFNKENCI
ncbi:MAG: hypothetical protein A3C55_02050 [Gammaproteobacteria bacterium RIFCSPHIGHO2_02_FULL_42_13]|nr:MAG: hypothetical protein A3C55_02050 [Gammaproteobacteria bacterium RIFCSPHIGHO2_02_FULL_42_13]OGT71159.1 MAG: hypothetical protein A3H43_01765 [Gammaproteobacteria bacterium RIFCSPLOWO2_02_FULL_42_9]